MFKRFGQLFSKMVEKVAHFIKNDEKSSIWPKLATLRGNYHVSAFLSTFQQKVVKSGSFREKWRQIIDLAKTLQLLEQAPMSLPFDELFRKKLQKVPSFEKQHENWSIWPKICNFSSKLPSFGIYTKSLAESWKKSLILWKGQKIVDLGKTLQLLEQGTMSLHFDELFRKKLQKVPRFLKTHEKSSILSKLATFRKNCHVLAFR